VDGWFVISGFSFASTGARSSRPASPSCGHSGVQRARRARSSPEFSDPAVRYSMLPGALGPVIAGVLLRGAREWIEAGSARTAGAS